MIRASMVGDLMSYPEKDALPDGAKTKLDKIISQKLMNWCDVEFDFFTTEKGKRCENDSIELYNEFTDEFYIKNVDRITIGNLTGECDILDKEKDLVIDIKTSYSKATHPIVLRMSKLYEWQLRAYMHLYDVNSAELAYCLVNTPDDLIAKKDPIDWHIVDDVSQHLRVRTLRIERCQIKEDQMLKRIELSMNYVNEYLRNEK